MSTIPNTSHQSHDQSQHETWYRTYNNRGYHASGHGTIIVNPQTMNYLVNEAGLESIVVEDKVDSARTADLKLLRKIDFNFVPFLALLCLLSFLSCTNIGIARLAVSLKLKGLDYNVAVAVFFPFYAAAAIPSNILMRRTGPSLWLCIILVACGFCTIAMSFVQDFKTLLIARMALGFAGGGLFPGVTWYITLWYRRHECGLRMAVFFSGSTLAATFGGLLALGITHIDGLRDKTGWACIFIVEGLATIAIALFARFLVDDNPKTAKSLTEEERQEINTRLQHDRTALADEYAPKFLFDALKDWKIYVHMLTTIGIYTPLYSISLILPIVVKKMGYTGTFKFQLMSIPPYSLGCIVAITAGLLSDRSKKRGPYMIFFCLVAIAGFAVLISTPKPEFQYIGTFLVVSGIYPNVALGVAWNGNNIGGAAKRAVGIAMHVGFGNLGGIIASFSFRSKDATRYFSSYGLHIGMVTMSLTLCVFMHAYLKRENTRRDATMLARGLTLNSYIDEYAEREKGDDSIFFRYTE